MIEKWTGVTLCKYKEEEKKARTEEEENFSFLKLYFLMNVFDGCCANNHIGKSFGAFIILKNRFLLHICLGL